MFPVLHFDPLRPSTFDGNPQIGLAESAGHPLPGSHGGCAWGDGSIELLLPLPVPRGRVYLCTSLMSLRFGLLFTYAFPVPKSCFVDGAIVPPATRGA